MDYRCLDFVVEGCFVMVRVTGGPWGLSREETWYNNARWRSGHRVVGRGSGGGRKVKNYKIEMTI